MKKLLILPALLLALACTRQTPMSHTDADAPLREQTRAQADSLRLNEPQYIQLKEINREYQGKARDSVYVARVKALCAGKHE